MRSIESATLFVARLVLSAMGGRVWVGRGVDLFVPAPLCVDTSSKVVVVVLVTHRAKVGDPFRFSFRIVLVG